MIHEISGNMCAFLRLAPTHDVVCLVSGFETWIVLAEKENLSKKRSVILLITFQHLNQTQFVS